MRKTHTQEFGAPVTAANGRALANRPPAGRLQKPESCFRTPVSIRRPAMFHPSRNSPLRPPIRNPKSAIARRRISPHLERVLSHPRGETQSVSPHCHTPTGEPQTTCAGTVGRNSPSFAPREKRKKFWWGENRGTGRAPSPRWSCAAKCACPPVPPNPPETRPTPSQEAIARERRGSS